LEREFYESGVIRMLAARIDRPRMHLEPFQHRSDITFRSSGSADFLDANIIHVEDAIALKNVAKRVDRPHYIREPSAVADALDHVHVGLGRGAEAYDDNVVGHRKS